MRSHAPLHIEPQLRVVRSSRRNERRSQTHTLIAFALGAVVARQISDMAGPESRRTSFPGARRLCAADEASKRQVSRARSPIRLASDLRPPRAAVLRWWRHEAETTMTFAPELRSVIDRHRGDRARAGRPADMVPITREKYWEATRRRSAYLKSVGGFWPERSFRPDDEEQTASPPHSADRRTSYAARKNFTDFKAS